MTRRTFVALAGAPAGLAAVPPRKPRKDCFFGIHFDLHPNDKDVALGRDVTDEMIERFLDAVRPDFVQYDCKGHAGFLGYLSQVSTPASNIVKDSLEIWRRVTARRGIGLYIHFSGVWDSLACKQRPEWARVGPDGKRDERQTSTFGPYVDERMIPQLKEAASRYDLDGAWVDGECWATYPDYCDAAVKAFREATGIATPPKSPKDKGWLEFLEINRAQFRKYVRHYVEALHRHKPGFQIASNWLYSTMVPERPELPVDFISGDYLGDSPIGRARLEARYMAATGMPWDLMAWGFQSRRGARIDVVHKPAVQIQQEAAIVLAQGGGFQIYYQPTRAGHIDPLHINVMARVAQFCRERQALCHKSETVPQAGVLFSSRTLYRRGARLFGGWGSQAWPAEGLLNALIECHYSVDVIPDWKLSSVAEQYPFIAVPDWSDIGEDVRQTIARYVESGGSALIAGAENVALFSRELGIKPAGAPVETPAWIPTGEVFANFRGLWQPFEPGGGQVMASRHPTFDSTRDAAPAAVLHSWGKGKIAGIAGPAGSAFAETNAPSQRALIQSLAARLFTPALQVEAPPTVEVVLRRKGGKNIVHLINTTARQVAGSHPAHDFVPEVGPIRITPRGRRPVTIPRLHIHTAIPL